MTEQKANKTLVEGMIRIADVGGAEISEKLYGSAHNALSYDEKAAMIVDLANDAKSGVDKLVNIINLVSDMYKKAIYCKYLTKEYVYCVKKILMIRKESKTKPKQVTYPKQYYCTSKDNIYETCSEQRKETVNGLARSLVTYGDTVVQYHDIEVFGSDRVCKDMEAYARVNNLSIKITSQEEYDAFDIREKDTYLGRKIWAITPILPMVILETPKAFRRYKK